MILELKNELRNFGPYNDIVQESHILVIVGIEMYFYVYIMQLTLLKTIRDIEIKLKMSLLLRQISWDL